MIEIVLAALWTVQMIFPPKPIVTWTNVSHMVYGDRWSFTPDVTGMTYEQRESYLGSIGQSTAGGPP